MRTLASSMTIDVVDELDRPIGTMSRESALVSGRAFRTAHVFLVDESGRILLQQLAQHRTRHAGRWGSSVAAYVRTGEIYVEAARRRLTEELGVREIALREVAKLSMPDEAARKFVALFVASAPASVTPDREVIADLRWESTAGIELQLQAEPDRFTPTFARLFRVFLQGG
jgi:isopentenyl-diphosphate delta-isomerase